MSVSQSVTTWTTTGSRPPEPETLTTTIGWFWDTKGVNIGPELHSLQVLLNRWDNRTGILGPFAPIQRGQFFHTRRRKYCMHSDRTRQRERERERERESERPGGRGGVKNTR